MDQKADLTPRKAESVARAFSIGLDSISDSWVQRQRIVRWLLKTDPLERLIPEKLLFEAVAGHLKKRAVIKAPLVVLMNRSGHGDGARTVSGLFPLLTEKWRQISLVHVSFSTPSRGLGALVRGLLVKEGAKHGVNVHVVAHNRPVEGLKLADEDVEELIGDADLVISFASGGGAGLVTPQKMYEVDPLLRRSHIGVLSFPDPDSLVADLPQFQKELGREPDLERVRFWVQVVSDAPNVEDLGFTCLGGDDGDAESRLGPLLDSAKRRPYRVLVEPLSKNLPTGNPLVCPCRSVIESSLSLSARVEKIVPAGSRLVAVTSGLNT